MTLRASRLENCPVRDEELPMKSPASSRCHGWTVFLGLVLGWLAVVPAVHGASLEKAEADFRSGKYDAALSAAEGGLDKLPADEDWHHLRLRCLLTLGRYPEARSAATNALARNGRSIRLVWTAREAFLGNGDTNGAAEMLERVKFLVGNRMGSRDPLSRVAFGRAALLLGADPKEVLEKIYAPIQQADPKLREVYLARGDLALEKHDSVLAAKAFEEGLAQVPEDADLLYGLARAYSGGDREAMGKAVEAALKANGRHVPTLLLVAENQIDGEGYAAAEALDEIAGINPWHPDLWAFRAVLAHLRNDAAAEKEARESALRHAPANPRVDHLIGRKLSEKYRFSEGAAHQREALARDPGYLPAKAQLASDLLRLGQEEEGWRLADEVSLADGYDVAAFNLVTLRDTMRKYAALTNEHFLVRMDTREAAIYGPRVLELLESARVTLCEKYGLRLSERTTVEIFASQKDFGVRTFGIPDNPGYLGVCFGSVVTANSPAANKANAVNWEAVLWHEFCHVVTLTLTRNKMPRWLSEGISTYEERQANPAWGERLNPRYREMILGEELVPIERLSAAFLTPKTPMHLQFAYYEASIVVEYLIEQHGVEAIRAILRDLGEGVFINEALERHTADMKALEKGFAEFARTKANGLAPNLDFTKPNFEGAATITATNLLSALLGGGEAAPRRGAGAAPEAEMVKWSEGRPANYWALRYLASRHVRAKEWSKAKIPLEKLVSEYPTQKGRDSAYALLALACRSLGETEGERDVLRKWVRHDAEAGEANLRLMELGLATEDWTEIVAAARRYLAVNPLVPAPYRHLARASEKSGDITAAVGALRTQLELDPPNPPEVHYHLARLLEPGDPAGSRRHVLQALEDAPRHRDALELLLKLPSGPQPAPAIE